jgi:molybdopterin-guanine dinucleotide biosynthesis protein A
MKVAGFVLTGGRSSRMGRDKALLPVEGQALCERIGDVVASVAAEVFLIGHPERYGHLKYRCVADVHPHLGPVSGLETALSLARAELHLVVSCDAFNVKAEWLRALVAEAAGGARCVVAEDAAGNVQPLCAVYRSECRAAVSRALAEGRLKMMDLLRELGARRVKLDGVVLNINTPEEYDEIANADSTRKYPLH